MVFSKEYSISFNEENFLALSNTKYLGTPNMVAM
jgi:hypothetical protein